MPGAIKPKHVQLRDILRSAQPVLVVHGLGAWTLRKAIALRLIRLAAWLLYFDVRIEEETPHAA